MSVMGMMTMMMMVIVVAMMMVVAMLVMANITEMDAVIALLEVFWMFHHRALQQTKIPEDTKGPFNNTVLMLLK